MESFATKGGNVAVLAHYRKPMKHPVLVELLSHWEELRDGRAAPKRSEINPRRIESALAHAFILEANPPGPARFRIAGMKLCDSIGMELRGMPAHALISLASRDRFNARLDLLFAKPEIVELNLNAANALSGQNTGQMLLLPMKNDAGEVARILGALVSEAQSLTPPLRFDIGSETTTRIVSSEIAAAPMPLGFAEAAAEFDFAAQTPKPTRSPDRAKPFLRLVSSDRD